MKEIESVDAVVDPGGVVARPGRRPGPAEDEFQLFLCPQRDAGGNAGGQADPPKPGQAAAAPPRQAENDDAAETNLVHELGRGDQQQRQSDLDLPLLVAGLERQRLQPSRMQMHPAGYWPVEPHDRDQHQNRRGQEIRRPHYYWICARAHRDFEPYELVTTDRSPSPRGDTGSTIGSFHPSRCPGVKRRRPDRLFSQVQIGVAYIAAILR